MGVVKEDIGAMYEGASFVKCSHEQPDIFFKFVLPRDFKQIPVFLSVLFCLRPEKKIANVTLMRCCLF